MVYREAVTAVTESNISCDENWNKKSGQIIWKKIIIFVNILLFKSHILLPHQICVENVHTMLKKGIGIYSNWQISCLCKLFEHMRY